MAEARDWEELRENAVAAAIEVLNGDEQEGVAVDVVAERVTDAILALFDEEALNRLADDYIKRSALKAMDIRNGASLDLVPAQEAVALWVGVARGFLRDAPNYTEMVMEFGVAEDPQRYAFILQKVGKLTPHQARRQAEAEAAELRAEVERLRGAGSDGNA